MNGPALDATFALANAAALLAGLIRGFAGFGSALTLVPALTLLYGARTAIPIGLVVELVGSLPMLWEVRRFVDWRRIALLGAPAVLATPLGAAMLLSLPADAMRRFIAAVVLAAATALLFGWRYKGRPHAAATAAVGAASGFLSGSTGLAGPPVILYQIAAGSSAAQTRALLTAFFLVTDLAALGWLSLKGATGTDTFLSGMLLMPAFAFGVWCGGWLHRRAGDAGYRYGAIGLLMIIGLVTLFG